MMSGGSEKDITVSGEMDDYDLLAAAVSRARYCIGADEKTRPAGSERLFRKAVGMTAEIDQAVHYQAAASFPDAPGGRPGRRDRR